MILITGLPLFAKRLARDLQSADPSTRYVALDTYYSRVDKLRFVLLLPFAEKVISMNGVTDESGSLNRVLKAKKPLVMQWMGTDILLALERSRKGTLQRKYVDYATNFCDSTWMQDELAEAGIEAEILHFKYAEPKLKVPLKYEKLKVLSYVAEGREEFYGLKRIIRLAEEHPEIPFEIIGTAAEGFQLPENVTARGWVGGEEAAKKMSESAIFLRLPEHDGFSASVTEALSYGAEVLWTFPFPPAITVGGDEDLHAKFAQTVEKVRRAGLKPNFRQAAQIRERFTKESVTGTYLHKLKTPG